VSSLPQPADSRAPLKGDVHIFGILKDLSSRLGISKATWATSLEGYFLKTRPASPYSALDQADIRHGNEWQVVFYLAISS
jgi:hypothetical protein